MQERKRLNSFSKMLIVVSLVFLVGFMVWLPYYAIVTTGKGGFGWLYIFDLIVFDEIFDAIRRLLK